MAIGSGFWIEEIFTIRRLKKATIPIAIGTRMNIMSARWSYVRVPAETRILLIGFLLTCQV